MSGIVVVGTQWGDEGKGKIVDVFAAKADMIVRFQGGANAGHTLHVEGKKYVLHQIPSGILHPDKSCVIAPAVVLDPFTLVKEIEQLKEGGLLTKDDQLRISDATALILPHHRLLDSVRENSLGDKKIGTTGRGIGPAYQDRVGRKAVVFADLFNHDRLRTKVEASLSETGFLLEKMYNQPPIDIEQVLEDLKGLATKLAPYRESDSSLLVHRYLKGGRRVLFEGAQGTLLDVNHGTYPYVTSSSTLAGAACTGAGLGPTHVGKVVGITKAYCTRVGEGPFPSELTDENGLHLQEKGKEFGSTTGRKRRCGWLDLVALKYSIRLNGVTNLALMKLDVLSGLKEIGVCTGYKYKGKVYDEYLPQPESLYDVEPIIEWLPGWKEDLSEVHTAMQLPRQATQFVDFVSTRTGTPIDVISVGPDRTHTLWIKPLFA